MCSGGGEEACGVAPLSPIPPCVLMEEAILIPVLFVQIVSVI